MLEFRKDFVILIGETLILHVNTTGSQQVHVSTMTKHTVHPYIMSMHGMSTFRHPPLVSPSSLAKHVSARSVSPSPLAKHACHMGFSTSGRYRCSAVGFVITTDEIGAMLIKIVSNKKNSIMIINLKRLKIVYNYKIIDVNKCIYFKN